MTNTPRLSEVPARVAVEFDRELLTRLRPKPRAAPPRSRS
jgi:hypothetical protein